jgi:hypothetical protein
MTHVPNGLAVFAALLLLATAIAGVNRTVQAPTEARELSARSEAAGAQVEVAETATRDKGFKMSLYLFRFNR